MTNTTKRLLLFATCFILAVPLMGQQFGNAVLVYNNTILAGDGQSQVLPGIVYVFGLDAAGAWVETGRIQAPGESSEADGFGMSMALDGNRLMVGAPRARSVHFYQFDGGKWVYSWTVTKDVEGFGSVVALSTAAAAVSVPGSGDSRGMVWCYRVTPNGELQEEAFLEPEKDELDGQFGASLALIEDVLLIGSPTANQRAGSVTVVERGESGKWIDRGSLPGINASSGGEAGAVMAANNHRLVVGAPGFADRSGTAWLFTHDADGFHLQSRLSHFAPDRGDRFGSSIGISGSRILIGSEGRGGRGGTGAVMSFTLDESSAVVGSTQLSVDSLPSGSGFGSAVSFNSYVAAVGASGVDNRAGAVVPFQWSEAGWQQSAFLYDDTEGYDSVAGELVACENEMAGDFPCKDVDMTSFVSMKDLGADRGIRTNDLWGWEDPETGREYAIVGLSNATSFVDVTDVFNPVYLGILPMPETANISVWRDMKVYKDHAYIVSDGAGEHGMQVFDLRQLRNVTAPVTFKETNHYPEIFSAHNIVINEETGFGYSVGSSAGGKTCGGGLHMIDLRDPPNPKFAGCFSDGSSGRRGTGYSHDAQCVIYKGPDPDYAGKEICIGSNETALSIADVSDKENPFSISIATYPNVAYAHQGWLTDDHRYFYLNDELDEAGKLVDGTRTLIWDLIDLDEPILAGEFIATTTETDHNLYVKGNLMYQSNTSAGLRILDITDPENPFETAYFDTSPVGGRGVSWSNYPYFKSGSIVVTGGHYGLFILKKKEVDL